MNLQFLTAPLIELLLRMSFTDLTVEYSASMKQVARIEIIVLNYYYLQ